MMTTLLPLIPFVVFFAWLLFFQGRGKSCPDCGTPLRPTPSPFEKTPRQWVEGGYVCQHCGCETDIHGGRIARDARQPHRALFVGTIATAVTAPVAALLVAWFFLQQML